MKVSVIMGSISDKECVKDCINVLKKFNINYEVKVISAHRALFDLQAYCEQEKESTDIYIAFAGKAAHLAGVIAGINIQPVIGVPVKSTALDGMDALLSTVQMPQGVPVATVAINGSANAAYLAIQMLSIRDPQLKKSLIQHKGSMREHVLDMNKALDF